LRKHEPAGKEPALEERARENPQATGCFDHAPGLDAFPREGLPRRFEVDARGNPEMEGRSPVLRRHLASARSRPSLSEVRSASQRGWERAAR
jgi:hypothetical protein